MALISQADSQTLVRDAVVLDLGDLRAQAARILDEARAEARGIIESAEKERGRLLIGAREQGHAEGLRTGLEEGRTAGREEGRTESLAEWEARLSHVCAALQSGLDAFRSTRERMLEEGRDDVLTFAITVAEQVSRRAVDLDRDAAIRQCEAALSIVLRPSSLVIQTHPNDLALVEEAAPALLSRFTDSPDVRFAADPSLARGSARVRTEHGFIEADVDAQIARIVECVRPAATPEPGEGAGRV